MAMSQAERVKRNKEKYQKVGLKQIKVWVHPDEAPRVREYARGLLFTEVCYRDLSGKNPS